MTVKASSNSKSKDKTSRTTLSIAILVGLVTVGLVWGIALLRNQENRPTTANYAEEVAKPLEEGLARASGVKKCTLGDAGRVSDNTQPWYNVYYELPVGREGAIETINKVASDNGYKLSHASKENRGTVPVADQYLDNWFYDTVGKQSPYSDLKSGKIELHFTVNNDGPMNLACGNGLESVTINTGANTSAVGIRVGLPSVAR
jgi:hypothetical protein